MSSDGASTISVTELRAASETVWDLIEAELGPDVELGADLYWHVDPVQAFNLSADPSLLVGSLGDDASSVREMGLSDRHILWHDLEHLIGLLRRIALLAR